LHDLGIKIFQHHQLGDGRSAIHSGYCRGKKAQALQAVAMCMHVDNDCCQVLSDLLSYYYCCYYQPLIFRYHPEEQLQSGLGSLDCEDDLNGPHAQC
jgi:hypothetical protein